MDRKLAAMAKGTVFARCRWRELVVLGRLFEVCELGAGSAIAAEDDRWLHVVLAGQALSLVGGRPYGIIGEGTTWPGIGDSGQSSGELRAERRLVALTELTLALVAARSLEAVAHCSPEVAGRLTRTDVVDAPQVQDFTTSACLGDHRDAGFELVKGASHG